MWLYRSLNVSEFFAVYALESFAAECTDIRYIILLNIFVVSVVI